jgi:hypothetical protein
LGSNVTGLGVAGGLFSETRTKVFTPLRSRPLTLALVSLKGNKGERPWDGAFLGLSRKGCQGCSTVGGVSRIVRLSEKRPPATPVNFQRGKDIQQVV